MSAYTLLKAVHLVAIAIWIGGMLANALVLLALPAGAPPPALGTMRRWNRWVTTPALLATWAAGIAMAVWGGWYAMGWLWAKAALVLALTALDGAQSATLRRVAQGARPPGWMQVSILLIIVALPIIATLAVGKPF